MERQDIVIEGAREHNLKNVNLRLPRGKLCVVTGLSGSGKSSLAFDTLYAEGQRKYVESLSAYARQFLDQMQKPDVDRIEGLSPAIAIEQRSAGGNPRSIVATTTEIHDYLRLLYAGIGEAHCPKCGRKVESQNAEQIVEQMLALGEGTKLQLLAPVVEGKKGTHEDTLAAIRRQGFTRVRVDGEVFELDEVPKLSKTLAHSIAAVVDRLVVKPEVRGRLTDSVELALRQGEGICVGLVQRPGEAAWEERLWSEKNACAHCGISFETLKARNFSFNSPYGACPVCHGLGTMNVFDPDLVVPDPEKSLEHGAIAAWKPVGRHEAIYRKMVLRSLARHYGVDMETPWKELPAGVRDELLHGSRGEVEFAFWRGGSRKIVRKPFEGVLPNLQRRLEETESEWMKLWLAKFMSNQRCPACGGKRLKPESLACKVGGMGIMEVMALPADDALEFFRALELTPTQEAIAREVLKEIRQRLAFLSDVGLGYLNLDRGSATLSGGEAQRIRLATQVGTGLTGVLYVLDEPSIGLHQRDNERLLRTLKKLRDGGNTVLVVEHDEQTIREADYVVDMGPGAGVHGGEVTFAGTVPELLRAKGSLTAEYLRGEKNIDTPAHRTEAGPGGWLGVEGAAENNLKGIDVRFPLGCFTCVTGVSGSGKSTLVDDILTKALFRKFRNASEKPGKHRRLTGANQIDKVIVIDQQPIGRTPRSNPATYTGAFDDIRALYAALPGSKVRGYGAGRFSFNVKGGRCERCKGDGLLKIEMNFLPDVYVPCDQCHGRRYNKETLEVRWNGKTIADVLEMTIDEALEFFAPVRKIADKFRTLSEVGLGYLKVGQPATTLSGGEAQRMKLSAELARRDTGRTLYLLDEPTTGLHFADVERLLGVLMRLRDAGNTLIVIEHNLDVVKSADWIVDLGPEGGDGGGRVVAEGTPEQVAEVPGSHTGRFLKLVLPGGEWDKRPAPKPAKPKPAKPKAAQKPAPKKPAKKAAKKPEPWVQF